MAADDCPICAKFQGRGPLVGPYVWEDDLVRVSHAVPGEQRVFLGHLIVETVRHARYLDGLTDAEASAVGKAVRDAAMALRAEFDVSFVHSAIINTGMPHFHQHVYPRHVGTPAEYAWHNAKEWPGAPYGGGTDVTGLCRRLAESFPTP